jgi:hypothetical protein
MVPGVIHTITIKKKGLAKDQLLSVETILDLHQIDQ